MRTIAIRQIPLLLLIGGLLCPSMALSDAKQPSQQETPATTQQPSKSNQWHRIRVKVTAYSVSAKQTQKKPRLTASGKPVKPGMVALSRDLEREFGLKFGDRIVLEGLGSYIFQDRMAAKKRRHVDIYMQSRQSAIQFGKQEAILLVPKPPQGP